MENTVIHLLERDSIFIDKIRSIFSNEMKEYSIIQYPYEVEGLPKQLFEEQIEHGSFRRLQTILLKKKELKENDMIIGRSSGILKREEKYLYQIFVMIYYKNQLYTLESDLIEIPIENLLYITRAQSNSDLSLGEQWKIHEGEVLKRLTRGVYDEFEIFEDTLREFLKNI
jgi:hypothetical protein